jgi:hypothetical protein
VNGARMRGRADGTLWEKRIIALGIVLVLLVVAVLGVLSFVGMEFIDSALR